MKHAGQAKLDHLEPLLAEIRAIGGLKERSRGVFYLKARACLHFHEDSAGLFADVRRRADEDFHRIKVDDPDGRRSLLEALRQAAA